jgi:GH18 family chitinase
MQPHVDFFNFMAYDLHGTWEASILGAFVRSQSSIIDIGSDLLPLWFDSLDPNKVNLGIPYYGRGYTLSDPSCTTVGCPYLGDSLPGPCTESAGLLSLQEINMLIQQDDLQSTLLEDKMIKEIVYDTNQWLGYDDAETIALKRNWADEHCLGGIAIWSMDLNSGAGR